MTLPHNPLPDTERTPPQTPPTSASTGEKPPSHEAPQPSTALTPPSAVELPPELLLAARPGDELELQEYILSMPEQTWRVLAAIPGSALIVDQHNRVYVPRSSARVAHLLTDDELTDATAVDLVVAARVDRSVQESDVEFGGPDPETKSYFHLRAAPLTAKHTLLLVRDTTEKHRVADVWKAFITNAAHEIKTPIGAIMLLAETIADNPDRPDMVEQFSQTLLAESQRLTMLVRDVFALNRADEAHGDKTRPVNMADVTQAALEDVARQAERKNATVRIDADENAYVVGEASQLQTAIRNLLTNAIAYTQGDQPITITVRSTTRGSRRWVDVAVHDHGPGVPEHLHRRVFERFFRVDNARTRVTGGSGLGLAIVKHVAINHKGNAQVHNHPHGGAVFTISLPQASSRVEPLPTNIA